jgi:hypothetical protein
MKRYHFYIILLCCIASTACNKVIDLYPQSNLNTGTFYSNLDEVRAALERLLQRNAGTFAI